MLTSILVQLVSTYEFHFEIIAQSIITISPYTMAYSNYDMIIKYKRHAFLYPLDSTYY
jgi:hypothetical protein